MSKNETYPNGFLTIKGGAESELVVRRSRFIAYVRNVSTKTEALAYLEELKSAHKEAVHYCYAYRMGPLGLETRMSDDGEPSGTAGKPIMFALQQNNLSDVVCIVVRYYGGTKLGVGPLARAYSEACLTALKNCETEFKYELQELRMFCSYDDVSRIIALLEEYNASYEQEFSDVVTFTTFVPTHEVSQLTNEVTQRTSGRAGFSKIST